MQVAFEVKAVNLETGEFEGYGNVKNYQDDGKDMVDDGAFVKTVAEWGPAGKNRVKVLALHRSDWLPVGRPVELREDTVGLYIKGKISDTSLGRDVLTLMRDGVLTEMSIGYETIKAEMVAGVRHIKELRLYEISLVPWAMNDRSTVTGVKAGVSQTLEIDDPNTEAAEVSVLQQALKLLADCIALVPKCMGNQASCDQCNAMIAQVMVLVGQAIAAEAADTAEETGVAEDPPDDIDLYERMEAIWRAVRALGSIQDGDWSYPRYHVECPRLASVVIEDDETGQFYQAPYTVAPDGAVTLGELQPVDIAWLPSQKARARRFDSKAGRRNSTTDKQKITDIFTSAIGLMDGDHMSTSLKSLFGSLDKNQRADLISALQTDEPDAKPKSAPGPAAAGTHPDEGNGAHSAPGAALPSPEIEQMALGILGSMKRAAGSPTLVVTDPAADAMAMLRAAAGTAAK